MNEETTKEERFSAVQTVVKFHLAQIAASIEPTPRLTLVVRIGDQHFICSTEEYLEDAKAVFDEAVRGRKQ